MENPQSRPQTPLETQHLVARAREGDRSALNLLAGKAYSQVARAARFLLRRKAPGLRARMDTSDLAQSAVYDALRALPSYRDRGTGSFRSWLLGILRNKLRRRVSYFTAERRDGRRDVHLSSSGVVAASTPTPLSEALGEEERTRLRQSMEKLPQRYGKVLELRYWRGLSWSEVGRELGVTEEAAQMLCRRALLKLREEFDSGVASGGR